MKHVLQTLLNFVLPPVCPVCNYPTEEKHTLCSKCFSNLRFISDPCCQICGRPFPFDTLGDKVCAKCLSTPPLFHKARAVLVYDEASKRLILPFKHADRLDLIPLIVKMMATRGKDVLTESDLIMPVPLHRRRLFKRKYNQSALLAERLAKHFHKNYLPDGLKRIRATRSQGKMAPKDRKRNVTHAFRIKHRLDITGKKILLIDDVLTTGATANECAKVLLKAGATQVDVLTFAITMPK